MERGPEYRVRGGSFTIQRESKDVKTVDLPRFVNMAEEGWWSGDLHVHRPPEEIELLMRAEDLHVAPVITWWNDKNSWAGRTPPENPLVKFDENRFYRLMAGEDERGGGALLYFNLAEPLPITGAAREHPSPVAFLKQAHERGGDVHVDIEKPFWWDAPTWVATGMCHSIGVCNNHQWRDGVLENEAWGKPRDKTLFPGVAGNARWTQAIYFHLLNCGLRLPPSAGSASGVLPNPVGYNRVYVHCGDELTWESWWSNLRAGRVVVTNGPLLRPLVNGELPGHVFHGDEGTELRLETALSLSTRDKIEYLEIIKDGSVVESVRLDDYVKAQGVGPVLSGLGERAGGSNQTARRGTTARGSGAARGSQGVLDEAAGDGERALKSAELRRAEFISIWGGKERNEFRSAFNSPALSAPGSFSIFGSWAPSFRLFGAPASPLRFPHA
jgi:hypothetical protein